MKRLLFVLAVMVLTTRGTFADDAAAPTASNTPEAELIAAAIQQRALVDVGDTTRLQHVLAKARRGEQVVIGVIGGSITAGARASSPELTWGSLAAKWWKDSFPNTQIQFINAGIGATGSDIGTHRVRTNLLNQNPDLVMVEFAVNDTPSPMASETLEGLIRQILKQPNNPAVMLLFTMHKDGGNAQQFHQAVGSHYRLPMASFRDALWPEIEAKRMAWEDIEADEVHPNDRGHAYCAQFMSNIFAAVLKDLPPDNALPSIPPIPAPCTANAFENAAMLDADALKPTSNQDWEIFEDPVFGRFYGKGWKTAKPGATLEFEVDATAISLVFYRIKGPMGIATAQVDDQPAVNIDAWFSADWGGYTPFTLVARDLAPGKHKLRIQALNEKNPASDGFEFRIYSVLTANPAQ